MKNGEITQDYELITAGPGLTLEVDKKNHLSQFFLWFAICIDVLFYSLYLLVIFKKYIFFLNGTFFICNGKKNVEVLLYFLLFFLLSFSFIAMEI